jgi:sulfatase maturation enzyme AslB (radical SAM superfamily)
MQPTVYCTAPWNGLTVREDGHVRTCCNGIKSLGDLNTQTIQEIENSDILAQIQQDLQLGQPNLENCKSCVDQQKQSGFATLRDHYNKFYPTIGDHLELKFLDIRWNNVCNLGCLYCTPTFSSTWADRLHINSTNLPVKNYQDALLEWVLERSEHINEIMLVGGEPLLMKQNYKLLTQLPEQCQISIITNMSFDLEKNPAMPALLSRPTEKIIWNVSLENTGHKFEYVRSGANWDQTKKNLKLLLQHWPETVGINMVYNLFSAFDLRETVLELHAIGIKKINLFNIYRNNTINLFNMPTEIKQLALQELISAKQWHTNALHPEDQDLYPWAGADELIKQLNTPATTPITLCEFESKMQWYDSWSADKFSNLWPEVNQMIQKHLK